MNKYIHHWNLFVEEWLENPEKSFSQNFLAQKHKGKGTKELSPIHLPQPYLGNPNECSAVTLNLNPGKETDIRKHPNGELVQKSQNSSSYFEYAKDFPQLKHEEPSKFWDKQVKWIDRIGNKKFKALPFAIEICPWHSDKWKDLDWQDKDVIDYLNINLFDIIDKAVENATIKTVLSVGKSYYKIFETLGFEKVEEITPENFHKKGLEYPKRKDRKVINRNFSLWRSKTGTMYMNTFTQGSNVPPAKVWNDIQNHLLNRA